MNSIKNILSLEIFNNNLYDYGKTLIILIAGIIVILVIKRICMPFLKKTASATNFKFDDFIINILNKKILPVLFFLLVYLSISHLNLSARMFSLIKIAGSAVIIILLTGFLVSLILFFTRQYLSKDEKNTQKAGILSVISKLVNIILWSIALIIFLDNLGIKITGLVTGLGISGVAVAFASQTVLKDVFSYFSIFLDKPFETGDFIIVDSYMGIVEHIGIKTTRIKSLSGEQLIMSNADLTNSRIRNYKRMQERRVVFNIGITYRTPLDKIKEIPAIIRNIIAEKGNTRFDRSHFSSFGEFSLMFETVYYINTNDYNIYMDTQQHINLRIKEEFEKMEIQFAYPTQLVYMEKSRNN